VILPLLQHYISLVLHFRVLRMMKGSPLAALTSKAFRVTVALLIVIPFSAVIWTFVIVVASALAP
jgi:hypothetical protein